MMNEDVMSILKNVGKKTKSKMASNLLKNKECEAACQVADQLFHETMEEVKSGDMSWAEAIKDLYENLKAVPMPKEMAGEDDGE